MVSAAVEVRDVRKRFGPVQALAGVSLEVKAGEFFALLGPNGAGKTTLISALGGLARPDRGSLAVMGHDVGRDFRGARRAVGIVPQEIVFDPFFRLEGSRSRETGCTGLGLSIARNIARAAGGDVSIRNRPAGGLEAVLVLPR